MDITQTFVESWRRQCACMNDIAELVTEDVANVKPSEDGWCLSRQLCHVQAVRLGWFSNATGQEHPELDYLFTQEGEKWIPSTDLAKIRSQLKLSGEAIEKWLTTALPEGKQSGGYDHPAFFLQHMVWHEGWHIGLIMLGLRLAGKEPTDEWEEAHLWGRWRVE
jgi:uncharacterized damage-inducible protein DinB